MQSVGFYKSHFKHIVLGLVYFWIARKEILILLIIICMLTAFGKIRRILPSILVLFFSLSLLFLLHSSLFLHVGTYFQKLDYAAQTVSFFTFSSSTQNKASITKLCPEYMNRLLYRDARMYCLAIKRNKVPIHATTWMNL